MGLFDKFADYFLRQQSTRAEKPAGIDTAKQEAHADLQRAARALQDENPGMSRAQARRAIGEALQQKAAKFIEEIGTRQRAALPSPVQPTPVIQTETTAFAPRPLTLGELPPTPPPVQAPVIGGGVTDQDITIENDGSSFVTITGTVVGGQITLTFVWDTTSCA